MDDATQGPQRMRYSFESRCRAVAAMVAGMSPGVAAQSITGGANGTVSARCAAGREPIVIATRLPIRSGRQDGLSPR